jgi:hypothetical protein
MKQNKSNLTLSVVATGVIVAQRFVTPAGAQAGDGVNAYGVADSVAAVGERLPVINQGTAIVETGAAIAAGALVQSDAQGRAITKAAGITQGRLAPGEVSTGAGQFVEVILINN